MHKQKGEKYTVTKEYDNYYTKRHETFPITYTIYDGFDSMQKAIDFLISYGIDSDMFQYVQVVNNKTERQQVYPVTMETLQHEIVITKGCCYARDTEFFHYDKFVSFSQFDNSPIPDIAQGFSRPRISSEWCHTILEDLKPTYDFFSLTNLGGKYLQVDACILLGMVFFDTMIPVYDLNVMDSYYADAWNSPSRDKLWNKGVKAYQPFRGWKQKTDKRPYTLQDFLSEQSHN